MRQPTKMINTFEKLSEHMNRYTGAKVTGINFITCAYLQNSNDSILKIIGTKCDSVGLFSSAAQLQELFTGKNR